MRLSASRNIFASGDGSDFDNLSKHKDGFFHSVGKALVKFLPEQFSEVIHGNELVLSFNAYVLTEKDKVAILNVIPDELFEWAEIVFATNCDIAAIHENTLRNLNQEIDGVPIDVN